MSRLMNFITEQGFVLALLAIVAVLAVRVIRKRKAQLRAPVSHAFAIGLGIYALGTTALANWSFNTTEFARFGFTITKYDVGSTVLLGAILFFLLQFLVVLLFHKWSYWLALATGCVAVLGLGGWTGRELGAGLTEVVKAIRYVQFIHPQWLFLLVFVPFVFLVSRRSLSGLGRTRKWVAISARALAVLALVLALAEPRVRRPSENVTVIFVVDRSLSIPQELTQVTVGNTVDLRWERVRKLIEESVRKRGADKRYDQAGLIFFGKRPKLALPPTSVEWIPVEERMAGTIDGSYTDIAAAMKLAMASFPEGNSRRIVLISDGNQNLGNVMEQAELARKNGVQVDTLTLAPNVRNENEVLITEVDAPSVAAEGDRRLIRVAVRNEHPTREVDGLLELVRIGRGADTNDTPDQQVQIEIDSTNPMVLDNTKLPARVRLMPKLNVFRFVDKERGKGQSSYTYKATFTPLQSVEKPGAPIVAGLPGDRSANNSASAAVVARGQRRLLFLDPSIVEAKSPHKHLINTLRAA